METIKSTQNSKIKLLKKLSLKKYRKENGKFMVENLAIIYDALKSGYDFESLFITENFIKKNKEKFEYLRNKNEIPPLAPPYKGGEEKVYLMDEKVNKYYSELDNPSGITAVYKIQPSMLENKKSVIYLNGASDPGNVGTIMRTALAFDFKNIVLDDKCADIYNAKTINAAKDAIFKLNIVGDKNNKWIKEENSFPIYAADVHNGISLEKIKIKKPFCLVLGSETHGISKDIAALAQKNIKIDISDNIESLNVAIAAAILMYKIK